MKKVLILIVFLSLMSLTGVHAEETVAEESTMITIEDFLNPTFIANTLVIISLIVTTALSIKQRVKIIYQSIASNKTDEELSEKEAVIQEQSEEIVAIAELLDNVSGTLNLIVQASKMSPQDKQKVLEDSIKTSERFAEFINNKQERLNKYMNIAKAIKEDPSQLTETINQLGGSVLEKYTSKEPTE